MLPCNWAADRKMINSLRTILIVLGLALIPLSLKAKAQNFDECILENISSGSTKAAVGAIMRACRNLFPAEKKIDKQPPINEPKKISIRFKTSTTDWVGNQQFGYHTFRVTATNSSSTKFLYDQIFMKYRLVGCDDLAATPKEIEEIQIALNKRGFSVGKPDGKLGSKTIAGIRKFKKNYGITYPDGSVTENLAKKLGVSVAKFDESRFMKIKGWLVDSTYFEPGESALIDFNDFGRRVPKNTCFQYRLFGETWK